MKAQYLVLGVGALAALVYLAYGRKPAKLPTKPPTLRPPVAQPPAVQPPVAQPPVQKPPTLRPPVAQPPVIQPPVQPPPTSALPAGTIVSFVNSAGDPLGQAKIFSGGPVTYYVTEYPRSVHGFYLDAKYITKVVSWLAF